MIRDIHFALRALLRTPVFTLASVLMLGTGIGLAMFMFSAMNTLVLQAMPFRDAARLVHVDLVDVRAQRDIALPASAYLDLRDRQRTLESLAAYASATMNLAGAEGPAERVAGAWVSTDALSMLGIAPILGRHLGEIDQRPGAPAVALIGHELWQLRFGGASDVVGRKVRINGRTVEIVGVMPPRFAFPREESIWMPLALDRVSANAPDARDVEGLGRLRDGVSPQQAQQDLAGIIKARRADAAIGSIETEANVKAFDRVFVPPRLLRSTTAMSIAVVLVLLIACANVASLVLARFTLRTRELAVRAALGANRRRLMLQVFGETVFIAAAASMLGYAGARVGGRLMMDALAKVPGHMPYWVDFRVSTSDIVFAIGIGALTALIAGWLPARRAARVDVLVGLGQAGAASSGRRGRGGGMLVAFEITLCTILLAGAALAINSSIKSQQVALGIDGSGVFTGRVALTGADYADASARARFIDALRPRLQGLPGVENVAFASSLPLMGYGRSDYERFGDTADRGASRARAWTSQVSAGYFEAFRIGLRDGRLFDQRDRADSAPVAIVSASFAATAWPAESAIGKRLRLDPDGAPGAWLDVVGVVADNLQSAPGWAGAENIFQPIAQAMPGSVSLVLRASGDVNALGEALRTEVARVDADLPVYWLRSMDDWRAQALWASQMLVRLFTIFAGFALVLAISGIHAVLAFDIAQRTAEIGVRRALGADARGVAMLVMRRAGRQVVTGLLLGIPLAAAFSMLLLNSLMPGSAVDARVHIGVLVVLLGAVALAAAIPVRRALRVDPIVALRHE